MLIVTVAQARMLVSTFGAWPLQSVMVVPDPPMYCFIFPSALEWVRN